MSVASISETVDVQEHRRFHLTPRVLRVFPDQFHFGGLEEHLGERIDITAYVAAH